MILLIFIILISILLGGIILRIILKKKVYSISNFENIKTNTSDSKTDKYIDNWHNKLFIPQIKSEKINYIITYHQINKFNYEKDCFNIIIDGEPNPIKHIEADMLITTKKDYINNENTIFVPYFVYSFLELKISPSQLIKNENDKIIDYNRKFCCFAYSNCNEKFDGVVNRKNFYYLIQKITSNKVDNLGKCYNKNKNNNQWWGDNLSLYKKYKFVIAFENSSMKGYITEKLTMPMLARAIPIYLGADDVSDYFNPKSFINVNDFENFEECIHYILKVDSDNTLYESILNEPYFHNNSLNKDLFSLYFGGKFYYSLQEILPINISQYIAPCNLYSENIVFITFSDGIKYKYDRIIEEAKTSKFFKECIPYTLKDLDQSFIDKHSKFIENNPRGYGYWIWKPYIILKTMEKLDYNDILIYSDSGSVVNPNGFKRLKYYYEILNSYDMICFKIKHDEISWNKKDIIEHILNIFGNSNYNVLNTKQITSNLLLLRNNKKTYNFIKLWYNIMCNYHLIDDTPSKSPNFKEFIENRHDQSILSLLTKLYYMNIYTCKDNYEDDNKNYEYLDNGEPRPFLPYRKK